MMIYALILIVAFGLVLLINKKKNPKTNHPIKSENINHIKLNRQKITWFMNGKSGKGELDVSQGLQVFDDAGNIVLDTNDDIPKILGILSFDTADGSITVNGKAWALMVEMPKAYKTIRKHGDKEYTPTVIIDGDKISWSECVNGGSMLYGVY